MVLYFEDVEIIKRRSLLGIPNAIEIVSGGTSFHLASFLKRDACFEQMMSLWKHCNVESYFCTTHRFERIDEMKIEPISGDSTEIVVERPQSPEIVQECHHDHSKNTLLCDETFPAALETLFGLLYGDQASLVVMSASQLDLHSPVPFMDWFMISRRGVTNLTKSLWTVDDAPCNDLALKSLAVGAKRAISFDMSVGIQTANSTTIHTILSSTGDSVCIRSTTTSSGVAFAANFETIVYSCLKKRGENESQLLMSFFVKSNGGFSFMKGTVEQAIRNRVPEYYQDLVQVLHDNFADHCVEKGGTAQELVVYHVNEVEQSHPKVQQDKAREILEILNHRNVFLVGLFVAYTFILLSLHTQIRNLERELHIIQKHLGLSK